MKVVLQNCHDSKYTWKGFINFGAYVKIPDVLSVQTHAKSVV